ncbi:MAG: peptide MFS transporter [Proteobacteria bacterium]|nr:peptide MFS transporter [Pseudomonadota bacterium]
MNTTADDLNNKLGASANGTVLDHPAGLFILFFTEMWERFSYYGMRALIVVFLISALDAENSGWGWSRSDALILFGWYIGLVYLTPVIGGIIADKFLGFKKAVILGAIIMTLGHASMAMETAIFFYLGLTLLILGNGLFKPNISSIVAGLYKPDDEKKDGAYTIFYMGVNAGAFLGIMLCGYVGEEIGYSWGFGLAGIFMLFGLLQFYFANKLFSDIGNKPKKLSYDIVEIRDDLRDPENEVYIPEYNEQQIKADIDKNLSDSSAEEKLSVLHELKTRMKNRVTKDRLIVIGIFAIFTIFFWMAFEQAGGSMTIFAKDYTQRGLIGSAATIFTWINTILTIVPIVIISYVLFLLVKQTYKIIPVSNFFITLSFVFIWAIVIWMINNEFGKEGIVEIKATWFGILNPFFIILFAPLFSKIWASRLNPSGPIKFALGLLLMGVAFAVLAVGALSIPAGAATAAVSIWWLIIAYWLLTMGELCLSPVGLSYVSKLAPKKLLGLMFGVWFLASFVSGILAGHSASYIDQVNETYGLSVFFLIFTIIPIVAGLVLFALTPFLKKRMHGIH